MAVQRAASSYSGVWSDPGNAYALSGDDAWATYTSTQRNGTHSDVFGFAGFSAQTPTARPSTRSGSSASSTSPTWSPTASSACASRPAPGPRWAARRRAAPRSIRSSPPRRRPSPRCRTSATEPSAARLEYRRGNSPTSATARCDYVYLEVGFTPGTVVEALAGLSAASSIVSGTLAASVPLAAAAAATTDATGALGATVALAGASAATSAVAVRPDASSRWQGRPLRPRSRPPPSGCRCPWPAPRPPAAAPVPTVGRGPGRGCVGRWPARPAVPPCGPRSHSRARSRARPARWARCGSVIAWRVCRQHGRRRPGSCPPAFSCPALSAATSTATARFASDGGRTSPAHPQRRRPSRARCRQRCRSAPPPASSAAAAAASRQRALTALAVAQAATSGWLSADVPLAASADAAATVAAMAVVDRSLAGTATALAYLAAAVVTGPRPVGHSSSAPSALSGHPWHRPPGPRASRPPISARSCAEADMALVLYAIAGNDAHWRLPVTEADGSPKDLSGATDLVFLVKRRVDDADADAVVSAIPVVEDAAGGILEVRLTPADTAALRRRRVRLGHPVRRRQRCALGVPGSVAGTGSLPGPRLGRGHGAGMSHATHAHLRREGRRWPTLRQPDVGRYCPLHADAFGAFWTPDPASPGLCQPSLAQAPA